MGKETMNRKQRRAIRGEGQIRTRTVTGSTPHFRLWMADLKLKSSLQRLRLSSLAESIDDPIVSSAMAMLYVGGIKNVWTLIQSSSGGLLHISGIDIPHLEAVEAYLLTRNVKPVWTVA